jgi:cardiolipin synthase
MDHFVSFGLDGPSELRQRAKLLEPFGADRIIGVHLADLACNVIHGFIEQLDRLGGKKISAGGPLVKSLQAGFAESWLETTGIAIGGEGYFPRVDPVGDVTGQIVKSSPTGGSFQNYMLFLLSINSAKKSILITNPYFMPDDVMTEALVKAAARGVRVMVLLPGEADSQLTYTASRSHYGRLLLGGIEVYEYKGALLHAKTIVVDGVWSTIGSTNFDNRSFALNQEINLTVYNSGIAQRMEQIFQEDLKCSQRITYEQWRSRGLYERLIEMFGFPIREQL